MQKTVRGKDFGGKEPGWKKKRDGEERGEKPRGKITVEKTGGRRPSAQQHIRIANNVVSPPVFDFGKTPSQLNRPMNKLSFKNVSHLVVV